MVWRPDYITTAELKSYVRVTSSVDDALYARLVTAASRAIDRACHRQFGNAAGTRTYPVRYSRSRCRWVVEIDDLQDATGLTGVTGYTLEPRNAVSDGLAWTEMHFSASDPSSSAGDVTITAPAWGWTAVPAAVSFAALLQGSRWVARRESPYGVAGSPQVGSELRLLERLDPDVVIDLKLYVREKWAA